MRVLIVGAFGTVTSAIIRKFGKEGAQTAGGILTDVADP